MLYQPRDLVNVGLYSTIHCQSSFFNQMLLYFTLCLRKKDKRLVKVMSEGIVCDNFVFDINTHSIIIVVSSLHGYDLIGQF